jgi:transcriptional regulator with XRE-family HTH domain
MKNSARKRFGQVLHEIRKHRGMTLERLAERSGTCKGYLSGIENGKCNPPFAKMTILLCKVLEMSPDGLLLLSEVAKAPIEVQRVSAYTGFNERALLETEFHLKDALNREL